MGTVVHGQWECRLMQPLWKTVWSFLKKLKRELPYSPAIPLLGPKTPIQKNISIPIFTAALFTIAKVWRKSMCPSVVKWIKEAVVHLQNGILHSHKKEI